jgi:hypothetical protein
VGISLNLTGGSRSPELLVGVGVEHPAMSSRAASAEVDKSFLAVGSNFLACFMICFIIFGLQNEHEVFLGVR